MRRGTGVEITQDHVKRLETSLRYIDRHEIMVGVPGTKTNRNDGTPMTNASIAYIHEHGVPEHNLPARPFLGPGVVRELPRTITSLRNAGVAATEGDLERVKAIFDAIGVRAVLSVRQVFQDQDFAPLAPSTIQKRLKKFPTTEERDPTTGKIVKRPTVAEDIRILIDKAKLLNSINYVIRKKAPGEK